MQFVGLRFSSYLKIIPDALPTENEAGETLGFILEEPKGFLSLLSRQTFATHRPFRAIIMDPHGTPLLWVRILMAVRFKLAQPSFRYEDHSLG